MIQNTIPVFLGTKQTGPPAKIDNSFCPMGFGEIIFIENQAIITESLNVKGMVKNKNLSKVISDVSWSEFTRQLEYKANWYGRVYHKIDTFFPSSQLCSNCGYQNQETKNLHVRNWACPKCNSEHDRDINAAINILNQGLKELQMA